MANLKIIADNAADRASITSSTTAGTLAAANMLTDLKGQVHRSTGTSVSYTLTWAAFETVAGVALPACNLTADSTIRVRGYDATIGGALVFDSGMQYAAPGPVLGQWDWSQPLNSNAFSGAIWDWPAPRDSKSFAYGGAVKTAVWLDNAYSVKRLVVDLVDTNNAAGFIDCARIVAGPVWSPQYNAGYGAAVSMDDGSKNSRNDGGDLLTDRFASSETLRLDLQYLPPSDRARISQIIRSTGVARPVFIALTPGGDTLLDQETMVYGKRQNSPIAFSFYNAFSTNITLEGW